MTTVAETKALRRFEVKELDTEGRTFEGLASTWEQDLGDDVIHPGAFKKTLKEWRASKRAMPLIDQHNYRSVRSVVGKMLDGKETDDGLWTKWEVIDGPDGDEVLRRLKGGYVDGLSIGYQPTKYDYEQSEDAQWGEIRHLREVELREVSVVIWGMNTGAVVDLDSVKAQLAKMDQENMTDEDRKELRRLASRIGHLLRDAPPAPAADAPEEKEAEVPDAPPGDPADAPKADEPPTLSAEELADLKRRLLKLRIRHVAGRST